MKRSDDRDNDYWLMYEEFPEINSDFFDFFDSKLEPAEKIEAGTCIAVTDILEPWKALVPCNNRYTACLLTTCACDGTCETDLTCCKNVGFTKTLSSNSDSVYSV